MPKVAGMRKGVKKSKKGAQAPKKQGKQPKSQGALASIGTSLGNFLGGPIGGMIGKAGGDIISKITGFGDYTVSGNSILMGQSVPTFQSTSDGVRICHREFVTEVSGTTLFSGTSYYVNPGIYSVFPWLASLASNFEQWTPNGVVFEYRSTSGTALASANAAMGVVLMSTQYNSAALDFTSKQAIDSYEYSTSTVPYSNAMHAVECKSGTRPIDTLFVRSQGSSAAVNVSDPQMYDLGVFQVSTVGMQSAYTVGEIWVSYDITFKKPKIGGGIYSAHLTSGSSPTAAAIFGTGWIMSYSNIPGLGINTINSTKGVAINAPGTYVYSLTVTGTGLGGPVGQNVSGSNVVAGPLRFAGNTSFQRQSNTTTIANDLETVTVTTSSAAAINNQLNFAANGTTITSADLVIVYYPVAFPWA